MTIVFSEATGGPVPKREIEHGWQTRGGLPAGTQIQGALIIGDKVAGGTGVANTVYGPLGTLQEGIDLAGAGSGLACQLAYYWEQRNAKTGQAKGPVYIVPIAEPSGGTVAEQDLTFATNATGNGTWEFGIGGHVIRVTARTGDTPTIQAAEFVRQFGLLANANAVPLSAANVAGVVTITANNKGAYYNSIGLRTITDPDIGTTDTWEGAYMGDTSGTGQAGAGVQATALTTLIAALKTFTGAARYVVPWEDDATIEEWIDHINTVANATNKIPAYLFCGADDSPANLATLATGFDSSGDAKRVVLAGIEGTDTWNGELAALVASADSGESHLARSMNGVPLPTVHVPAEADQFTEAEATTCLDAGVTPLWVAPYEDEVSICRIVSATAEYGYLDFARIKVADYTRQVLDERLSTLCDRASIIPSGYEVPDVAHVIGQDDVGAVIYGTLKELEGIGYLARVDELWESYVSVLSGSELRAATADQMVDQLHNVMLLLNHII